MKKFLSLVLALVMTMSLVTISAGAKDFTDDSKLNYKEAVDVISAVKVVDGYADGSFNPQATLTRGAAAKIICNLILGPTTAAALVADAAPFSDVPANSTFAGYIAFCSKEGIISGYADGTFKPGNSLTGYAFMKMLLGALGYDKSIEGYDGANWSINVAKRALAIGLDDGLVSEFNGVKPVTREEACLYAFNTLTADMVDYDNRTTVSVGGAEVVIAGSKAEVVANNAAASKQYNNENDGKMQFCEKYFSSLKLDDDEVTDAFGRPANTWYKKADKIGTYAKAADLTYTKDQKSKTLYADLDCGKNYVYDVVIDGNTAVSFDILKKGTAGHNAYDDTLDDVALANDRVGNGSLIEVYKDEQVITVVNTYLMQVSGDYDTKNEDLDLIQIAENDYPTALPTKVTLSSDDFAGLDAYNDEDYVMVTIADGVVKSIAPAEVVTATVTEYVHEEELTAGGEKYEYSAANNDNAKAYSLKDDYKLYLDPYGYVLWADGVSADDQYVFIYEFSQHTTSTKASVNAYGYFTDGTEAEMDISKINGTKVNASMVYDIGGRTDNRDTIIDLDDSNSLSTGDFTTGWYKFVKKDTGKYELTSIAAQTNPGNAYAVRNGAVVNYGTTHTVINDGAQTKDGNKATIFVVLKANGDVVTYEGIKNVADITGGTNTVVDMYWDGRYAKCVFVDLKNGTITGGANSSDTVFFYKRSSYANNVDDDNYYIYKALVNGEEKKVYVDQTAANYNLLGLFTDIEYSEKTGFIVGKTQVNTANGYNMTRDDFTFQSVADVGTPDNVQVKKNTLLIHNGTDYVDYYMADDCVIYLVDDGDYETVSAKQLAKDDLPAGADFAVAGVMNSDAEYTALYIYRA